MKTTLLPSLLAGVLTLLATSCGQPAQATQSIQNTLVASQTVQPVTAPLDISTEEAGSDPTLLPNGFASDTGDGLGVSFFGLDGLMLGETRLPQQARLSKDSLHMAGANMGSPTIPLIYFQFAIEGNCDECGLWLAAENGASQLMHFNEIEALTGVPGADLVAVVERLPQPDSAILRSSLFLGGSSSLPGAQSVLVVDSRESLVIVPVAIRMNSEDPTGIYYTQRPYGIGGEILFDPLMGLSLLDLATNTSSEILPSTTAFSSLSASQKWVAYAMRGTGVEAGIVLRELESQEELFFQVLPDSDRGAGMLVVSPDDTRLAWLEARGSLTEDNFHSTLRVASMDGRSMLEFPQEKFIKTAGVGEAIWVTPFGWLDNSNLLVGVRSMGKDSQSVNLRLDVLSGQVSYLAPGEFMGFLYP